MRYLWESVLEAQEEGIPVKALKFVHSTEGSPYQELAFPCLNQTEIGAARRIEVNTYHRFYQIFAHMFPPDQSEYEKLRESLTNLILHILASNDARKGMTREEYYKKMLLRDFRAGVFGEDARQVVEGMKKQERDCLLGGWLRSCKTGSTLAIFGDMVRGLIEDSILYRSRISPDELLLFTGYKKTKELEQKIGLITDLFLEIRYHVEVYYEYHVGIIGVEETMQIDEIAIC